MFIKPALTTLLAAALFLPFASAEANKEPSPAAKPAAKKLVLEKGTGAAEIRKAYGTPDQILPIESPDKTLKAEQWIYRRKAKETVTQEHLADNVEVYTFTTNVTNGNGTPQPVKISTPVLKSKRVTLYQVTSLLIVAGQLELARVHQEQEESYL
ncbi:hypothetical protein ESB00_05620 [Oleiharenicola lentus]|uniref:Outer membrane protein assembly factor BamE n=1 Tax=Oleiharenicola lentus TaxID=2508720 RepID=A0A4Q1C8S8_9BACT|nr:hypothetical protein [Oleiharenicola lentus]RXK55377.1 hypothetical protein ESB00_05620 [Oleiharenicola lentus]